MSDVREAVDLFMKGLQAAKERGPYKTVCPKMVEDAVEVLESMLK